MGRGQDVLGQPVRLKTAARGPVLAPLSPLTFGFLLRPCASLRFLLGLLRSCTSLGF